MLLLYNLGYHMAWLTSYSYFPVSEQGATYLQIISTLEKTDRANRDGKSRDTGNIWHTIQNEFKKYIKKAT